VLSRTSPDVFLGSFDDGPRVHDVAAPTMGTISGTRRLETVFLNVIDRSGANEVPAAWQ
jgi:hypothetical protein